ncbi:hypothetical protein [Saccharothrix sp. Mg75]|uniref:hypothetical protein n=1 Tax=Saccharothrix sp. Mg75 TaxID=3445357 RepID=UPI003EEC11DA
MSAAADLLPLDAAARRAGLLALRGDPAPGQRVNSWLGLLTGLEPPEGASPEERLARAGLAVAAVRVARECGDVDDRLVVERCFLLCAALLRHGLRPADADPALDPDALVRALLDVVGRTSAEAAATPWRLPGDGAAPDGESLDVLRSLRRAGNLSGYALHLVDHVRDAGLRAEVESWRAVRPDLP